MVSSEIEGFAVEPTERGRRPIRRHGVRIAFLIVYAAALLVWPSTHASVLFADGLRYIAQAQAIDRGAADDALRGSVDHPVYPLAIVAAHRVIGGDGPVAWQTAAQAASAASALLLVVPLYLIALELFGAGAAVPACLLTYSVPATIHVFADTLSESTFLLFWSWGLWSALQFLKTGSLKQVPLIVVSSALAYLTRPEGLLLPAALGVALVLSPRWVLSRLPGKRSIWVVGSLALALAAIIGPYIALKGGLGTKPSIARLLGTAPKSDRFAVERQRPLDVGQTEWKTLALAGKGVSKAVVEAMTWPLVFPALLGLVLVWPRGVAARQWTLLWAIGFASVLALLRLHATGGYCTSRHTLILAMTGFGAAGLGIETIVKSLVITPWYTLGMGKRKMITAFAVLGFVAFNAVDVFDRLNPAFGGYRKAGDWLATNADPNSRIIDVTGWSQFYSERNGYTFADLVAAPGDPSARWVVVREAHLKGPWLYCKQLSDLVDGLDPVETFTGSDGKRPTRVYLFDRQPKLAKQAVDAKGGATQVR